MLSREVAARETSGAGIRMRSAGFPTRRSLEDFNLSQRLSRGEARSDVRSTAVGCAGGRFTLQASGQEFLVGPGLGAGPLSEAANGLAQGRGLQSAGQQDKIHQRSDSLACFSNSTHGPTGSGSPLCRRSAAAGLEDSFRAVAREAGYEHLVD